MLIGILIALPILDQTSNSPRAEENIFLSSYCYISVKRVINGPLLCVSKLKEKRSLLKKKLSTLAKYLGICSSTSLQISSINDVNILGPLIKNRSWIAKKTKEALWPENSDLKSLQEISKAHRETIKGSSFPLSPTWDYLPGTLDVVYPGTISYFLPSLSSSMPISLVTLKAYFHYSDAFEKQSLGDRGINYLHSPAAFSSSLSLPSLQIYIIFLSLSLQYFLLPSFPHSFDFLSGVFYDQKYHVFLRDFSPGRRTHKRTL